MSNKTINDIDELYWNFQESLDIVNMYIGRFVYFKDSKYETKHHDMWSERVPSDFNGSISQLAFNDPHLVFGMWVISDKGNIWLIYS